MYILRNYVPHMENTHFLKYISYVENALFKKLCIVYGKRRLTKIGITNMMLINHTICHLLIMSID